MMQYVWAFLGSIVACSIFYLLSIGAAKVAAEAKYQRRYKDFMEKEKNMLTREYICQEKLKQAETLDREAFNKGILAVSKIEEARHIKETSLNHIAQLTAEVHRLQNQLKNARQNVNRRKKQRIADKKGTTE